MTQLRRVVARQDISSSDTVPISRASNNHRNKLANLGYEDGAGTLA